jgi:hypothetical protein
MRLTIKLKAQTTLKQTQLPSLYYKQLGTKDTK